LSRQLLENPVVAEKIVIGDFRSDIEADRQAETIIRMEFPEVDIITSVEGNKLIPISSLLRLNERIKNEIVQANLEHERALEQTSKDAYKSGYEKGFQEGLSKGHYEAQKVIDNFASLINDATGQREILYNEARQKILELILDISRKITFDAARIDHEVTAGIIAGVIDKLVDKSKITVKVHPDHYPLIEQQIDRFKGDSTAIKEITIEPDPRVRRGGCYVETPTGDIDARVDSQMDIIAASLADGMSQP